MLCVSLQKKTGHPIAKKAIWERGYAQILVFVCFVDELCVHIKT